MDELAAAHEPVASTSRAVFHLPYKPTEELEEDDQYAPDELWFRLYEQAWAATSTRIHRTLASLHDASLDSIVAFVHDSRDAGSTLLAALAGRASLRTGLIVGANPTSSPLLFSALCLQLTRRVDAPRARSNSADAMDVDDETLPSAELVSKQRQSCIVSRLTSRECGNIKMAMRSVISGFIGGAPDVDDEDEDEGPLVATSKLKSATLPPEDMQNLTAWFAHRYRRADQASAKDEPTLVVLLEDLEGMDGKVLGLMFETLSRYVTKLPLVFLLGVATSADALSQVLWRGVTNLLDTATFFVEPGIGTFNALMRGLFVDWEAPLALGPKAFTYLMKSFEETHHSIDATVSALQSVYMTHFRSRPQAFVNHTVTRDILPSLPDKLFRVLSMLPSLQGATSENADIAAMLASDENGDDNDQGLVFMRGIEECRRLRKSWQNERRVGIELLETMMDFLEKRWSAEKMLLALEEGTLSSFSDELCGMALHSTSAKLPRFLNLLIARLSSLLANDATLTLEPGLAADSTASETMSAAGTPPPPDMPSRAAELLDSLVKMQDDLTALLEKPRPAGRINFINDNIPGASLMYPPGSLAEVDKEYSKIVKELSEILRSTLSRAFRPSTSLLLHEVWFSDDLHPLRRFHPAFLPSFQRTLRGADSTLAAENEPSTNGHAADDDAEAAPLSSSPAKSRQSKGKGKAKEQDDASILAGGPSLDVAVAYRLYKETGKTINLGDWWTAFEAAAWTEEGEEGLGDLEGAPSGAEQGKKRRRASSMASGEDDDEDSDEDEEEDSAQRRKQARFLRAIGDLAYCGFLQPTTRKQEHVLKTVF